MALHGREVSHITGVVGMDLTKRCRRTRFSSPDLCLCLLFLSRVIKFYFGALPATARYRGETTVS